MTPGRLLYLARRRWQLGFRHWVAERFLNSRIAAWRVCSDWPPMDIPVHTLTSRYDWEMALWMLVSLHETTERRWPIHLHEDGSLGEAELACFRKFFPEIRIIQRTGADAKMRDVLAAYPRCASYRKRMPHGIKIFDIPQMTEAARFLLIDPDVLFFEEPAEILQWVSNAADGTCWFNQDFQEPSPISPQQAKVEFDIDLWPRINSGLCLLTRASVSDLDAMEHWLGSTALQAENIQWRVEQTLFALSASKAGKGGLLPPSYEVSPSRHRLKNGVARHYVGVVRDRFWSEGVWQRARRLRGKSA